jgi:hypothetical protein
MSQEYSYRDVPGIFLREYPRNVPMGISLGYAIGWTYSIYQEYP